MTDTENETVSERLRREARELSDFYKLVNARAKEINIAQRERKGLKPEPTLDQVISKIRSSKNGHRKNEH